MSALERSTRRIGTQLLRSVRSQNRNLAGLRRGLSDKLMSWAMSDPEFKVQLFRFVDVFPTLRSPTQIHDVLVDYLQQPGVVLPRGLEWGLKAGGVVKSAFAKTVSSNIVRMAQTFIAGRDATEAIPALRRNWRQQGIAFSVDLLGEACLNELEAEAYRRRYRALIAELSDEVTNWPARPILDADAWGPIPRANVSIKISSLSAHLKVEDFNGSLDRLYACLEPILDEAERRNVFINFDMEQAVWKDLTISLFKRCCERHSFSAGLALQAYLKSGPADAADLIQWSHAQDRQVTVRLIKGAYWDYEVIQARAMGWPIPVWTRKEDTDACFEAMVEQLISGRPGSGDQGGIKLAVGSHNVRSVAHSLACTEAADLPSSAIEFQLLEGMALGLQRSLVEAGHRVRTYVPLGELIPGMAYLVRRLLENTSNESWLRVSEQAEKSDDELLAAPSPHPSILPAESSQTEHRDAVASAPVKLSTSDFMNEPLRDFSSDEQREAFAMAVQSARLPARPQFVEAADVQTVIRRAVDVSMSWSSTLPTDRARMLITAAQLLRNQRNELSAQVILEAGKTWREADADVCEAIDFCEYYARSAIELFAAPRLGNFPGELNVATYRSAGITAVISPWNFPLAICAGMTVAALAAGNSVLLKPAEQTSRIAQRLCEVLWQSGVPRDVLQFVPGQGETVGAQLVEDSDVAVIAFTGSREVGFQILRTAGHVGPHDRHIKKVICEMGGKNAIIVDSTADLDEAVAGVCDSAFRYAGQKCSACSRVIVVGPIYDAFLQRLVETTRSLTLGDPRDPATDVGPIIDADAADRIRDHIETARRSGQPILALEPSPEQRAQFSNRLVGPHIFAPVRPTDALWREEVFGPVLAVVPADSIDQALTLANDSVYKLTGAIYSRTPTRGRDPDPG